MDHENDNQGCKQPPFARAPGSAFDEGQALAYDPFAGDDGESRILADSIVTTRRPATCHQCGESIALGQRTRSRREVYEGEFIAFRWCEECTRLMAEDTDDAFEARFHPATPNANLSDGSGRKDAPPSR